MCLFLADTDDEEPKVFEAGQTKRDAWKVVKRDRYAKSPSRLLALWRDEYEYLPGWNTSDRPAHALTPHERTTGVVQCGIHVFLNEDDARRDATANDEAVVRVVVHRRDFVAAGIDAYDRSSAVFTRVFLPKDEYERAMKAYA